MEMSNHPYLPRDLNLPDFVPNLLSDDTLNAVYIFASLATAALVWLLSGWLTKTSKLNRLLMCWWMFTGLTHIILEGYFTFSPEFYKDQRGFYLAEVWKEYSKADSRYADRDVGVVAVVGITAVLIGPASLLAVYAIARNKAYSYVLQLAISIGQIYATAVLFITTILDGSNFSTSSYYYYSYYIAGNSLWVVIATLVSIRCWSKICASFAVQNKSKVKDR